MKISTHGRYGLRFMLDLATNGGDRRPVSLKDVSRRQGVSIKYLWHIVRLLRQAGLIESRRGMHGGYVLTRAPRDITLADIIMNLEGGCLTVECVRQDAVCDRTETCAVRDVWRELEESWVAAMKKVSLQVIVDRQGLTSPLEYSI